MKEPIPSQKVGNLRYATEEIAKFFGVSRRKWDELYASEQWVFQALIDRCKGSLGRVLDVGCAAGGLFDALSTKSSIEHYHGVDINPQAIKFASESHANNALASFECADILESNSVETQYDLVCSLSCADWNVDTLKIIQAAWKAVKPGGNFVISLRLTDRASVNALDQSYQFIVYDDREPTEADEIANYVVFNANEVVNLLLNLGPKPSHVLSYGYWGFPSKSARTPFEKLVFAVFLIQKNPAGSQDYDTQLALHLPADVLFPKNVMN
jgi:SAM-dependent methyltransferase